MEIESFFRDSKAFQVLPNGLRETLLPRSLINIIRSASVEQIWLSDQQEQSLSNQFKALVEDYTKLEWNWWPMEPRMRFLKDNETRLLWRYVSSAYGVMSRSLIINSHVVDVCGRRYPVKQQSSSARCSKIDIQLHNCGPDAESIKVGHPGLEDWWVVSTCCYCKARATLLP